MRRTLKARLTFWNLLIIASALALFAVLLYVWAAGTLYRHHDADLREDAQRLADILSAAVAPLELLQRMEAAGTGAPLLTVRTAAGEVIFRSSRLAVTALDVASCPGLTTAAARRAATAEFFTVRQATGAVRFICLPLARPAGAHLQLGRSLGDVDALLRTVVLASLVLIPVVIVLTSFGGLAIARRALAPIDDILSTLESIQATDLSRRVDPQARDAEVTRLSASINRLLDRLQASFGAMREFTADVSHQLQTPLAVIKGTIDEARKRTADPDDWRGVLEELGEDVDALSSTVQDLRDYALAEVDSVSLRSEPVDLTRVFEEDAEVGRALAEAHGIACATDIAPGLTVRGNPVRLRQVLLNLVENAVRFTPAGGRIRITATGDERHVRLSVDDTGHGIAPETLPHVFERHFCATQGGRTRGSGLGLAIVKRIVDAHRGQVDIQSTVGVGTTVAVTLPAAHGSAVRP